MILLFSFNILSAQNNFGNIWYFPHKAGLDFSSGNPKALFDGEAGGPDELGGAIVQCDLNGNLLFYSAGKKIYNRLHDTLLNGSVYTTFENIQPLISIPNPSNPNQFYVFARSNPSFTGVLSYFIVDIRLDNGKGGVLSTKKDVVVPLPNFEAYNATLTGTRHANGHDFWIQVAGYNQDTSFAKQFYAVLVSDTGVGPVVSSVSNIEFLGSTSAPPFSRRSQPWTMKSSYNGKKTVVTYPPDNPIYKSYVEIADFNPETGQFFNFDTLPVKINNNFTEPYGIAFSPNDSLLYIAGLARNEPGPPLYRFGGIVQYQLHAPSIKSTIYHIPNSGLFPQINRFAGGMQMAPNGKIYVANYNNDTLTVINNPNGVGAASNFNSNGVILSPRISKTGLPHYLDALLVPGDYTGCVPFSVNFQNPYPSASAWLWKFPDGTTSNLQNPSFNFTQGGQHSVLLTGTFAGGSKDSTYLLIEAYDAPSKFYNLNIDTVCQDHATTFQIDTNGWLNMRISIMDTATKSLIFNELRGGTYQHTFSRGGEIPLWAIARNTLTNCIDTVFYTATVHPKTNAFFTTNDTLGCVPHYVQIHLPDTTGIQYHIDWGNGTDTIWNRTGGNFPPSGGLWGEIYDNPGLFQIKVKTTSPKGCLDSFTLNKTIRVLPEIQAGFGALDSAGCQYVNFLFIDSSQNVFTYPGASIFFDFGDGTDTLIISPPSGGGGQRVIPHTYTQTGNYTIRQIVTNGVCSDTLIRPNFIFIEPAPKPGFTSNLQEDSVFIHGIWRRTASACPPFQVEIQDISQGSRDSIYFNFGNGTDTTLLSFPPSGGLRGDFLNPGHYQITQEVFGTTGCRTFDTLFLEILNPPIAGFTYTQIESCGKVELIFQSTAQNADSIYYNFGNGQDTTLTNFPPSGGLRGEYSQTGIYTIQQIAWNSACYDTTEQQINIFIEPAPVVNFGLSDTLACLPAQIIWTDSTTGNLSEIYLNWGNGRDTIITNFPPSGGLRGDFPQQGIYQIQQIATGRTGCIDTLEKQIEIINPIQSDVEIQPIAGCSPLTVEIINRSNSGSPNHPLDVFIDWGNGRDTSINNFPPSGGLRGEYSQAGTHLLQLIQTNGGCSDTINQEITVEGFDGTPTSIIHFTTVDTNENEALKTVWRKEKFAQKYQVYISTDKINYQLIKTTTDTFYLDVYANSSEEIYYYKIIALDSCGNESPSQNYGSNILLKGKKLNEETAELEWNLYENWLQGIEKQELIKENFSRKTTIPLNINSILHTDFDFYAPDAGIQIYRILTYENNTNHQSLSNKVTLEIPAKIFFPTAFSPEASPGINDKWIFQTSSIKSFDLKIYNRWGELIFQQNEKQDFWDGKHQGNFVPAGIYPFVIRLETFDGKPLFRKGMVMVVR